MSSGVFTLLRKGLAAAVIAAVAFLGFRAYQSTQGPALRPWHTIVPVELPADAIARGDWNSYVAAETRMFDQLHRRLQGEMQPRDRTPLNRYNDAGLTSPRAYAQDWNRSFVLEPEGAARGVVVLLHGLTDSPYSMRSLAQLYRGHGFIAIAPRMPGHGTVPAALTHEGREEWEAAVGMTMAEATRRADGRLPVHLVAYSNGAAVGLLHVFDRIERGEPAGVDRIVLLSPMIEIRGSARYVGLAGLPAIFPRYAKAAWLDVLPEYNPFKYNSFPVRAARESYLVTTALQSRIDTVRDQGRMAKVPPILAFQSVLDDTVEARAVKTRLFDKLDANGSELVVFDVNRTRVIAPMLETAAADWAGESLQGPPRRYAVTVVGTASAADATAVARTRAVSAIAVQQQPAGARYPLDVYSLSHIALPFRDDDPLYGRRPPQQGLVGADHVQLGAIALRGERNGLVVSQGKLGRLSYNPLHAFLAQRIAAHLPAP